MADKRVKGRLTDAHLMNLSHRLTNYGNLRSLAYRGLKLKHHEIERCITNKPNDLQLAAHDILVTWLKQQEDSEQAFCSLHAALQESQLQMLADELVQWDKDTRSETSFRCLNDSHIQQLSQRLTETGDLRSLAYRGLKLESQEIEPAINNKSNDIQATALEILQIWLKQQKDRKKAFHNLHASLQESQLQILADELIQWTQDTERDTKSSRCLTDSQIQRLSQKIANTGDLRSLAYRGLKLEYHEIEPTINNKPNDVQAATHEILQTWFTKQHDREEALNNLLAALRECEMQMLADELERLTKDTEKELNQTEILTDLHIVQISKRIFNVGQLRTLATKD